MIVASAHQPQAVLIFVAFHPEASEVERLRECLAALDPRVGYAVVANDHRPGEAVDALAKGSLAFLGNRGNPGYGRAVNQMSIALRQKGLTPPYLAALNTDLAWSPGTFETLLAAMESDPQLMLLVPQLLSPEGEAQHLCKQHPTLLGLFSRRFVPDGLKQGWLQRYDRWYVMADADYNQPFQVPYLSGCCMLFRSETFEAVGGFDERFFLYLEDADLTRSLGMRGRTLHWPAASVVHHWGRGNHRSWKLTLVNFHSAWVYFRKWGLKLW